MKQLRYAIPVFLGGCSYGILSTFVKLAYASGFSSSEITRGQYFIGTILIWGLALLQKREKLSFSRILKLILAGTTFGMTGIFYYQALQSLDASLAIIFLFQFVWIGSLFDYLFYKKVPSTFKIISLVILVAGSLLAANIFSLQGMTITLSGAIWGILSAISYSTSIFFSGKMENSLPPVQKSAFLTTGAFLFILCVYPPHTLSISASQFAILPYILLLGFFGVFLPTLLFAIGMPHIGPSLGSMLSASELPVAVTMSVLVLHESIRPFQWVGVLLILFAIFLSNYFEKESQAKTDVETNQPFSEEI